MKGDVIVSFRRQKGEKQKSLVIFGNKYNRDYNKLQKELAKEFYDTLIENIKRNTFKFKLSVATLRSRRSRGITSTVPFIETGDYIKAIFVDGVSVKIKDGIHEPSGLRYRELFFILEFGRRDKSIPARPVVRRTRSDFARIANKRLADLTSKYLKESIIAKDKINIKIRR